jgi:hypothetical protein
VYTSRASMSLLVHLEHTSRRLESAFMFPA